MKTFFIIVNPNADHGQAANVWEQVEQILLTRQVKYEAHQTTHV
ncbi:MAG TPA: transcriptional regulator, partial [Lactobacillus sp.]|nr:transcriptional regulator [Lactobacillus sp.]